MPYGKNRVWHRPRHESFILNKPKQLREQVSPRRGAGLGRVAIISFCWHRCRVAILGVPACLTLQHLLVYFLHTTDYALNSSISHA